jgi:hypothetical protein
VTKTVDLTSFSRTWGWTIDKSGQVTNSGTNIHYTIDLTATPTDSDFAISGGITVHNSAPIAATVNSLSDLISGSVAADVDCGVSFPYQLAGGTSLECDYSAELADGTGGTNTATATLQNYQIDSSGTATASGTTDFSGSASITFSSTPSSETDECVNVQDIADSDFIQNFGPFCANDSTTDSASYDIAISPNCGGVQITNTVTLTTNDSGTSDSDSVVLNESFGDGSGPICTRIDVTDKIPPAD